MPDTTMNLRWFESHPLITFGGTTSRRFQLSTTWVLKFPRNSIDAFAHIKRYQALHVLNVLVGIPLWKYEFVSWDLLISNWMEKQNTKYPLVIKHGNRKSTLNVSFNRKIADNGKWLRKGLFACKASKHSLRLAGSQPILSCHSTKPARINVMYLRKAPVRGAHHAGAKKKHPAPHRHNVGRIAAIRRHTRRAFFCFIGGHGSNHAAAAPRRSVFARVFGVFWVQAKKKQ